MTLMQMIKEIIVAQNLTKRRGGKLSDYSNFSIFPTACLLSAFLSDSVFLITMSKHWKNKKRLNSEHLFFIACW